MYEISARVIHRTVNSRWIYRHVYTRISCRIYDRAGITGKDFLDSTSSHRITLNIALYIRVPARDIMRSMSSSTIHFSHSWQTCRKFRGASSARPHRNLFYHRKDRNLFYYRKIEDCTLCEDFIEFKISGFPIPISCDSRGLNFSYKPYLFAYVFSYYLFIIRDLKYIENVQSICKR